MTVLEVATLRLPAHVPNGGGECYGGKEGKYGVSGNKHQVRPERGWVRMRKVSKSHSPSGAVADLPGETHEKPGGARVEENPCESDVRYFSNWRKRSLLVMRLFLVPGMVTEGMGISRVHAQPSLSNFILTSSGHPGLMGIGYDRASHHSVPLIDRQHMNLTAQFPPPIRSKD